MKFSTQILLCFLTLALLSTASTAALFYRAAAGAERAAFTQRYQALSGTLAAAFEQIETGADRASINALRVLQEVDRHRGVVANPALAELATSLGMHALNVYDADGQSIRLSDRESARGAIQLFDLCHAYRDIYASSEVHLTPFLRSLNNNPSKFAMMASSDGQRVITTTLRMHGIHEFLEDILRTHPEVLTVGLYAPDGSFLAAAGGGSQDAESGMAARRAGPADETFQTAIPATVPFCCQCVQAGLALPGAPYAYQLQIMVSTRELSSALALLRVRAVLLFAAVSAVAVNLGIWLARRVGSRVGRISATAAAISHSGDLDLQTEEDDRGDELSRLAATFNAMVLKLRQQEAERVDRQRLATLAEAASWVAHDIRAPLAALDVALKASPQVQGVERDLIEQATGRIRDLANNLLDHHRGARASAPTEHEVIPVLEQIVAELAAVHQQAQVSISLRVDPSAAGSRATLCPAGLKRAVANIVNNSVEASAKTVTLHVRPDDVGVSVEIRDDGHGMPESLIAQAMKGGVSVGKESGCGLGLSSAVAMIRAWGGRIRVSSRVSRGTTVTLALVGNPC